MTGGGRASERGLRRALGPGVLFTGAAVGVSHLVQSTRAGAAYGFAFLALVVVANVLKYPAFRFGPQYTVATGHSLLEGSLTVVDGFPRAVSVLVARFGGPEDPAAAGQEEEKRTRHVYWITLVVLAVGAIAVLWLLLASLEGMVDLATTLSFLTAPVLAWLNHRAVLAPEVPATLRPRPWLRAMSWLGIVALGGFAAYYLWLRLAT